MEGRRWQVAGARFPHTSFDGLAPRPSLASFHLPLFSRLCPPRQPAFDASFDATRARVARPVPRRPHLTAAAAAAPRHRCSAQRPRRHHESCRGPCQILEDGVQCAPSSSHRCGCTTALGVRSSPSQELKLNPTLFPRLLLQLAGDGLAACCSSARNSNVFRRARTHPRWAVVVVAAAAAANGKHLAGGQRSREILHRAPFVLLHARAAPVWLLQHQRQARSFGRPCEASTQHAARSPSTNLNLLHLFPEAVAEPGPEPEVAVAAATASRDAFRGLRLVARSCFHLPPSPPLRVPLADHQRARAGGGATPQTSRWTSQRRWWESAGNWWTDRHLSSLLARLPHRGPLLAPRYFQGPPLKNPRYPSSS